MEPKRILVVDDVPNITALMQRCLEKAGYTVDEAENGAVAWEMLQDAEYDLVVSDLLMPEMNGPELVQKIREDNRLANLPFVLLTARPADVSREEIAKWHTGSNGVILKPFHPDELIRLVNRVLSEPDKVFDLFLADPAFR